MQENVNWRTVRMGELLQEEINENGSAAEAAYPEDSALDPLDQAASDHEAYSASRRGIYFGREEYALQLISHVEGDGPPLVVTGEAGLGKSALLANWTHFWSQRNPQTPLLIHFIGAAPDTTGWMPMLRRFLGEFHRTFGLPIEIPHDPYALRVAFANALHMVAARARMILVIDALDQLEDAALDLDWLPPVIPSNIRLIVSTLTGRPWVDLQKRAWPVLHVKPLSKAEREALVTAYLTQHQKSISAPLLEQIAAARPTGNPLYLTTLLNELRSISHGDHLDQQDGIDERLTSYLDAPNPLALFTMAMQRWEQDCAQRDPQTEDLVGESLSRLWAAGRGLSESELLQSLGHSDAPFPRALWSPLHSAMGEALVNRNGLLTFAHPLLRQAVRDAYLPATEDQKAAHLTLATFFYGQSKGPRQFEELPWQWQQAGEWNSLSFLLAQPGFFAALWKRDHTEVRTFWTEIEANSPLRMETVYAPAIRKLNVDPHHAGRIGDLLSAMGRTQAAMRIRSGLVKHFRETADRYSLQAAIGNYATILQLREDLKSALALYREQELLCRELLASIQKKPDLEISSVEIKEGLQIAVAGQAAILYAQGDLDRAMALYQEQESLCRELGHDKGITSALGGQASILYAHNNLRAALTLLRDYENLCRERGDKYGQAGSLGNQALIVKEHGELDEAMKLLGAQERLYRELGHQPGVSNSLGNQATILSGRGDLNGAMARYKEQERICREVNHPDGLATSLANQAVVLIASDRPGEARLPADLALTIATRHNLQQLIPSIQRIRDSIAPAK
jgi:tetratricopeptide (TPR) repeat protein